MARGKPSLRVAIPKVPTRVPKPQVPGKLKPLGNGTGEANPAITPTNSQKGIRQQVAVDVPGLKTR